MATILVPVDYSQTAKNAYGFALQLAGEVGLDVRLMHVYNRTFVPEEPMLFEGEQSLEDSDEKKLKSFAHPDPSDPDYELLEIPLGVTLSYESVISLCVAERNRREAEKEEVVMVVMGTTNKTGALASWLGSTSSQVSETAEKPVLLIPPGCRYRGFGRMVVANHYESADRFVLETLSTWAKWFESTIYFVHVISPKDKSPHGLINAATTEQLLSINSGEAFPFQVESIERSSVADGLQNYAKEQLADLLVIVNKQRSSWRALIHSSLTQHLALTTDLPLLVMHVEPFSWTNA